MLPPAPTVAAKQYRQREGSFMGKKLTGMDRMFRIKI
jgi:hypothetical protein